VIRKLGSLEAGSYLAIIYVVSVLLRVVYALYLGSQVVSPPMLVDQLSYHTLAVRLLTGHGFSFATRWYPSALPDAPTAFWSFGYVLYLAAVYALFGVHPLAARLVGAVLGGILLPWLVHRLARRLFPGRPSLALLAAACAALYAYFILYAATLMTETFYIAALLWSLERALALAERPTLGRGATLGLSLGLAALLRQSILPWLLPLFAWLLWVAWRSRRVPTVGSGATAANGVPTVGSPASRASAPTVGSPASEVSGATVGSAASALLASAFALSLCILPFTVRNYRVYGHFLLLNSNAGYAMYSAQHPMHGTSFREFDAAPVPPDLAGLNEAQLDRELMRRGIGFILADPGRYLLLSLSRVRDYFEFWPAPATTLLHNVGRTASFGLFLPFMLYGLWLALRHAGLGRSLSSWLRFSTTPLALALLFVAFYSLLHVLTWAMIRYRLPVDAVLLPFAALALADLWHRFANLRQAHKIRLIPLILLIRKIRIIRG
jgi:hypothetical protein